MRFLLLLVLSALMTSKRARLQPALHVGHASLAGITKAMARLRNAGEEASNRTLRRANHTILNEAQAVEELELTDGTMFRWEFADPNSLLEQFVASSPALQDLFATAWRRHPCGLASKWSVIIGLHL